MQLHCIHSRAALLGEKDVQPEAKKKEVKIGWEMKKGLAAQRDRSQFFYFT
jgi:hypothetical protein